MIRFWKDKSYSVKQLKEVFVAMLSEIEKLLIIGDILKKHAGSYGFLYDEQMLNYVELLRVFLETDSNINQRGCIDTMNLLIKNAMLSN
jgi:hypothetical protein